MKSRFLLLAEALLFCLIFIGCSGKYRHDGLAGVERLVEKSPEAALAHLDSIDCKSLSDADRHYYDLLTIKAADKAYITHTSDSLILRIIEYYDSHRGYGLYPEALYYGGRVYSDLGDYPTALRYFQKALDLLPADASDLHLRGNVLSQTGRLLNTLKLYGEAVPYMHEAIKVDSLCEDSLNMIYDIQLLGAIYLHSKEYDQAEAKFQAALALADVISPKDKIQQEMYLAGVKYKKGEIDSALTLIRDVIGRIGQPYRSVALAYASYIYKRAGILDTAYMCAGELVNNPEFESNKETGYDVLLSPALMDVVPVDSVRLYAYRYGELLDSYLNQSELHATLLQNSFYNYQLHDRQRVAAEETKAGLQRWIAGILVVVFVLVMCVLYLKNRSKSQLLQLHEALNNINLLKQTLNNPVCETPVVRDGESPDVHSVPAQDYRELQIQLRNELLELQQSCAQMPAVPQEILQSEACERLQQYIRNGDIIAENDDIWTDLERVVSKSSKDFKYRLQLLTGGALKRADYHVALLIKCGVTPTQMTSLLGRTKGTISYRREALCQKVFERNLGAKVIDDVIRRL